MSSLPDARVETARIRRGDEFRPPPMAEAFAANAPRWLAGLVLRPRLLFLLHIGAVLAFFLPLDTFLTYSASLPAAAYREPALVLELARSIGVYKLAAITAAGLVLLRYGALAASWRALESGASLRLFVVFLCALIAWPFVTYGYNYYFDQSHLGERLVLLALVPLIWWRPLFVYPYLLLVYVLMHQLVEPSLGGSTILAHKIHVLRVIGMFGSAFLVYALSGYRKAGALTFLICCQVAAAYWLPALAKIELGWLSGTHLQYILPAAYAHGWLSFLSPSEVARLAAAFAPVDLPARAAVLAVETACLFFLWRRSFSIALLLVVIVFHLGVFALYGFFFWTWIGLDLALLALLIATIPPRAGPVYGADRFVLSILLIGFGAFWARPPELGWYDTPLSYTYRLTARTSSGDEVRLHPRFFAPYEDIFTMGSFAYLSKEPRLPIGPYGVTYDTAARDLLNAARNEEDVFRVEKRTGLSRYDPDRAAAFHEFIRRFVANRNRRPARLSTVYAAHAPLQFWSFTGEIPDLQNERVREIVVTEATTFFDGERLAVLREQEVARIRIPAGDETPPQ